MEALMIGGAALAVAGIAVVLWLRPWRSAHARRHSGLEDGRRPGAAWTRGEKLSLAGIAVGAGVGLLGYVLPEGEPGGQERQDTKVSVLPSRLVSSERVGLFNVELDGSSLGAINVLGRPTTERREDLSCTMVWEAEGVEMNFYNLGGEDPCVYGRFCNADITGKEWSTAKGLKVGDRTRRLLALYPEAEDFPVDGVGRRYVLDPPTAPCGVDVKGGLEAWTGIGQLSSFKVSFSAGGD